MKQRALIVILAWLLGSYPVHAESFGAIDPFGTERDLTSPRFATTADAARCDKEQINKPLTLTGIVDLSLCNNPQTRSLWASARAQAAQIGSSMSTYLPTLSLTGSESQRVTRAGGQAPAGASSRSVGISINYLLYDFGSRAASVENAKQLLFAANATRDATLQATFLNAVQSYFSLLSARASVQSTLTAETSARESLSAAQARHLNGSATPADRLQAQTALSQATLNRITAEGNAINAAGTLSNLMGFYASQPFELANAEESRPDPVAEQGVGELIEQARRQRPDLSAAEAQIRAAEAQLAAARAAGKPSVSISASSNRLIDSGAPSSLQNNIGVSVSVQLFTGMRTTYQTRAAEAQLESRIADRDRIANQIALDVWRAWQTLQTNSQALRSADDLLAAAEQSEKMITGRYKAGLGNILDVLTAQTTLASARQQHIAARYAFQSSRFALTQAIGQLDMTQLETRP
ncbi:MAG: TolC family protein [Nitrosomonadales bacterium]|nr:TolC family protein [Nitrosomonadales bacterium]